MTRRVLFCTIGQTPQIVTETVWALHQRHPPWVPDAIHIVTTSFALGRIRAALQAPSGPLASLFGGALPPVTVHLPRRSGEAAIYRPLPAGACPGDPAYDPHQATSSDPDTLADVNSQEDAARMGNLILRVLAGLAAEENVELHVSLAGGRKTMSAHALLALALAGHAGDEASHVLVAPAEFEDHPEFWHPAQGGFIRRKAELRQTPPAIPTLDPKNASVVLVPTPVPLLRYDLKNTEVLQQLDLIELIKLHNLAVILRTHPRLQLDIATNAVIAGDVERTLSPKLFAIYRLIATARKESWPGVGPEGTGDGYSGWLSIPHICAARISGADRIDRILLSYLRDAVNAIGGDTQDQREINEWAEITRSAAHATRRERAEANLRPNLTNLRKKLRLSFGAASAIVLLPAGREQGELRPIKGEPPGSERAPRFGLLLPTDAIHIG